MNAIEFVNISKSFKTKGRKVDAVQGLSFSIECGEVFGCLGPNGAGKTTTIKMLMGLIRPTAGQARIMGNDATSHLGRRVAAYLPENPAFYDYLTGWEYLKFVGRTFGMNTTQIGEKSEEVLRLLNLWEERRRSIRSYSKGMVQRLGLAQALIHDPEVYVLDEPMSGLDPLGRALVKKIILDLKKKGKSVFFSTHITSDVEAVCDRVGIILNGRLRRLARIESIAHEGLTGYQVRLRKPSSGERLDQYVPKEEFSGFLKGMLGVGYEIEFLETKRKDLETFFLDVVRGSSA